MRKFPNYPQRSHKSGRARIRIQGKDVYLDGLHGSKQSWDHYRRLMAAWASGGPTGVVDPQHGLSVGQLVDAYLSHCESYYGPDATETRDMGYSAAPLLRFFVTEPACEMTPKKLKAVRAAMLTGTWRTAEELARCPKGSALCRRTCNQRVRRIVRMFAWGVEEGCIPSETWHALQAMASIGIGRDPRAKDYPEIEPVPPEAVVDTLPFMGPVISAMVRVQLLTGMRPGEVCRLTADDLDRNGVKVRGVVIPVWIYRPAKHKTQYRGKARQIAIGPQSQAILREWVERYPSGPLFRPKDTPNARKALGATYTTASYGRAVARAAVSAGVPRWTPLQLRHNAATEVEGEIDLDHSRAVLGHSTPAITKTYAAADLRKAAEAAMQLASREGIPFMIPGGSQCGTLLIFFTSRKFLREGKKLVS